MSREILSLHWIIVIRSKKILKIVEIHDGQIERLRKEIEELRKELHELKKRRNPKELKR